MARKDKLPWVKWFPEKYLNGIRGLDLEVIGLYSIILNMIYDNEGPIPDDRRRLGMIVGMRAVALNRLIETLVDAGKLIIADGVISNPRAEEEITKRRAVVARLRENGEKNRQNADTERDSHQHKNGKHFNGANGADAIPAARPDGGEIKNQDKDSPPVIPLAGDGPPPQPLPDKTIRHNGRGTRLPRNWQLSEAQRIWSRHRGLTDREVTALASRFKNYYLGTSGSRGTSPDWDAKWQSWVDKQAMELGRDVTQVQASKRATSGELRREEWQSLVQTFEQTGRWNPDYGPPPGHKGFRGPQDLCKH
jgi:uncharacterized protein YdaU (DUF1376 family)